MVDVGGAVEIVVAEPFDHGVRQQNAGLGFAVRGMLHRQIGGRIDQHLAGEFWAVAVARGQRHHSGKIAAGAVAADQQVPGVDAELASVVGNPLRRGDGVIGGGGEFAAKVSPGAILNSFLPAKPSTSFSNCVVKTSFHVTFTLWLFLLSNFSSTTFLPSQLVSMW